MNNMITEKELNDFGVLPVHNGGAILRAKPVGWNENGKLEFVVTTEHNKIELALSLPEGMLFLGGIQTIEELKIFEKAITSYEPNY